MIAEIMVPVALGLLLLTLAAYADEVAAGFAVLVAAWRDLFGRGQ